MKIKIIIIGILVLLLIPYAYALREENVQIFGAEPMATETDKGRSLLKCLAGYRQFVSAGIGYSDFTDYWRDFVIAVWSPMQFADIMNVQEQLNKSRYAVMAAFMRCDLDRLKSVTESYYRLDAELYFVRHFVDLSGGVIRVKEREEFVNDLLKYMWIMKPAENKEEEELKYEGYFDLFAAKYAGRAKQYRSFAEDPVYQELVAKLEEFQNVAKDFKKMGSEMGGLVNEAIVEPVGNIIKAPADALWKLIAGKFDACVETKDNRYCALGESHTGAPEKIFGDTPIKNRSDRRTYDEVITAIQRQDEQKTEDIDEAHMLARYEMLYGQVGGEGIKEVTKKMDDLINEILEASPTLLNRIEECAAHVNGEVCFN